MKKTKLFVFSVSYPFGWGETFLEAELKYHARTFDRVVVLPLREANSKRALPNAVELDISCMSPSGVKGYAGLLKSFFSWMFWVELFKSFGLLAKPSSLGRLLVYIQRYRGVSSWLNKSRPEINGAVLYTYWLGGASEAIGKFSSANNECSAISRVHGYDLYNYRSYIPRQLEALKRLDRLYAISDDGRSYLASLYQNSASELSVSRLGVARTGKAASKGSSNLIVSCSSIVPVKRLDRIIDALALLNKPVTWVHLGGGPLQELIENLACEKLSENLVNFTFMGAMSHEAVIDYFCNENIGCLVNTSESEGIPVSIMEAYSAGIPVIAPDIGGVSEIVDPECGVLLNADFRSQDLANAIEYVLESKAVLAEGAYRKWENEYNEELNYSSYSNEIKNL